MTWWERFVLWLTNSTPGGRREAVETWLSNNKPKLTAYASRQSDRRTAKGHFFQRTKGWARPTDNDDDPSNDFAGAFPSWADITVDVREEPGGLKAWTLRIWVTELDASVWVLSYDSEAGLIGWSRSS